MLGRHNRIGHLLVNGLFLPLSLLVWGAIAVLAYHEDEGQARPAVVEELIRIVSLGN